MHGFTGSEWIVGDCMWHRTKPISMFTGQCLSHLGARLLLILTDRSFKEAEPRNQLPISKSGMNLTDMTNLNISVPVGIAWSLLKV